LKQNGPKRETTGKEIKSNVTDNESAMMATWPGTLQDYNGQALAHKKHQVILIGEVFGNGQDHGHVPPMLDGAKEHLKKIALTEDFLLWTAIIIAGPICSNARKKARMPTYRRSGSDNEILDLPSENAIGAHYERSMG
jgi:hypothetical protein